MPWRRLRRANLWVVIQKLQAHLGGPKLIGEQRHGKELEFEEALSMLNRSRFYHWQPYYALAN